jgi:phage-related protein
VDGVGAGKKEPKLVQNTVMLPRLKAAFYAQPESDPPSQPVRDWLLRLPKTERVEIGCGIQAVQFGWPLGLPLVRRLQGDLWEVRTSLVTRIARVIFAVDGNTLYLLHGFIKTTQKNTACRFGIGAKALETDQTLNHA